MCKVWALRCLDRQSKNRKVGHQRSECELNQEDGCFMDYHGILVWICRFESSFWASEFFSDGCHRLEAHSADTRNPKGGEVPAGGRFCSLGRLHAADLQQICSRFAADCSRLQLIAVRKEFCNKVVFSNVFVAD